MTLQTSPTAPVARTAPPPRDTGLLRRGLRRLADEDGAATAEYAITTMAANDSLGQY
ncbi:DUF4244 domain-containing protein [Labedella endophytica]|uniref:DUF4244 domain-containing protein n=1 Tax=Labedella endophytica TaxID=1523160 RepID=A0A433JTS2_9MICO|nr:DUF4244 domain-containing protein [Labedella endophytica]RUR01425.1 DUF4244 domain-containing protein [Labedella endophytica]